MATIRAAARNGASQRKHRIPRIPPSLFAIASGLAGLADLRDPVLAPFVPVITIVPMILATVAFTAGRILVVIFLAVTLTAGGWLTGQWIAADLDQDSLHTGYFLPTVAGGLVGAGAAAFSPRFWAFTFPYAAAAADALLWIARTRPPDAAGYAIVVITLITVFIAAIAARTIIAITRRQFLPAPLPAALPQRTDRQPPAHL